MSDHKKIILLLLCAILLVHNSSFAQYFNKYYDCDSSNDWGHSIFVQPDSSYFAIVLGLKNTNGLMTLHISKDGTQVLDKHFTIQDNVSYYAGNTGQIQKLKNSNYLVPLTLEWQVGSDFNVGAGMALLDSLGDTILTRVFTKDTGNFREELQQAIVMPDNGYLFAGSRKPKGGGVDTRTGLLIRTDSLGNAEWIKNYGTTSTINSIEILNNGKILAGAMNSTLVWVGPGNFYHSNKPHFFLLDSSDGYVTWDTLYKEPFAGGGGIHTDKNGGYYHVGATDSVAAEFPGYIAHLDENFRISWIKYFFPEPRKAWWNFKQTNDSGYIIVGATSPPRGWAAKINKEGNVVWEHIYVYNNNDAYLTDVAEKPGGGFIFTGNAKENNADAWRLYDVWMLSVDSNGCLAPGCDPNGIINVPKRKEAELSVYPNPTNSVFFIENAEAGCRVQLFDIVGREVYRGTIENEKTQIDMGSLPEGAYILQLTYPGGRKTNRKVLKE